MALNLSLRPKQKIVSRRRFQRVKVSLLGRFMLSNREEHPCQMVDMSPGGARIIASVVGLPGERVVAYFDHIGRVEGKIARLTSDGFAFSIEAPMRKYEKLAAQLTWFANQSILGMPEDRRHTRHIPRHPHIFITLESGVQHRVRVIDISLSGAAVETTFKPVMGTILTIGKVRSHVVRKLENGFAVEFSTLQPQDFILDLAQTVGAPLA